MFLRYVSPFFNPDHQIGLFSPYRKKELLLTFS